MRLLVLALLLSGCASALPGGPWAIGVISLAGLLGLGFLNGRAEADALPPEDASVEDVGDLGETGAGEMDPMMNVCLCQCQLGAALPPVEPLPASLDTAAILAKLPTDVRDRLS